MKAVLNVITEKKYELFFGLYEEFLNLDSIVSLTQNGRGRYVIGELLNLFSTIIFNKSDGIFKRDFKKVSFALGEYQDKYYKLYDGGISKFRNTSTLLDSRKKILTTYDIYSLQESFKDFYLASKIYSFYIPEKLFKQSLMEFNNSIAHIYTGRTSNIGEDKGLDRNFQRAVTHLQRGTLDFYKDIFITYFSKEDNFINNYLCNLQKLRAKEYGLIGDNNKNRKIIIDDYHKFFLEDLKITDGILLSRI